MDDDKMNQAKVGKEGGYFCKQEKEGSCCIAENAPSICDPVKKIREELDFLRKADEAVHTALGDDAKADADELGVKWTYETAAHDIRRIREEKATIRAVLAALTLKITSLDESPDLKAVFHSAWAHGVEYTGPNWKDELQLAKDVLAMTGKKPDCIKAAKNFCDKREKYGPSILQDKLVRNLGLKVVELEKKLEAAMLLVNKQAEDTAIFYPTHSAPEAYLQQELRKLHEIIEGKSQAHCAAVAIGKMLKEDN